jgi:AAA ATPase domain
MGRKINTFTCGSIYDPLDRAILRECAKRTNIWGEVYDTKHLVSTGLGSRSRGFVWFFSFVAWYSQIKRRGDNVMLLLDEPGLTLHGRAQGDLLRYFEQELKPDHQLIYSTHSPFMVDPTHFDRVRIVQDLSIDKDDLPRERQGTKITEDIFEATDDSLFPLQGALGYEIHQTLFIGPNSLLVEGPADPLYIQAVSAILGRASRHRPLSRLRMPAIPLEPLGHPYGRKEQGIGGLGDHLVASGEGPGDG